MGIYNGNNLNGLNSMPISMNRFSMPLQSYPVQSISRPNQISSTFDPGNDSITGTSL